MLIKCLHCGNESELVDNVCGTCEVKADYIVIEQEPIVVEKPKRGKRKVKK